MFYVPLQIVFKVTATLNRLIQILDLIKFLSLV